MKCVKEGDPGSCVLGRDFCQVLVHSHPEVPHALQDSRPSPPAIETLVFGVESGPTLPPGHHYSLSEMFQSLFTDVCVLGSQPPFRVPHSESISKCVCSAPENLKIVFLDRG